ncbi:MAG: signal peptide peptidase SppA [Cyclobacteriaceae bacterium]
MKFLRNLLATIVGLFVFMFLCIGILIVIASATEDKVVIKNKTVLHLKLDRAIQEREIDDPFSDLGFLTGNQKKAIGLYELKNAIKNAKTDDKIEGILLEAPMVMAGYATAEDIRNSLEDFKESGKFLIAYSEYYSEGAYFLSSIADTIITNPDYGMVEFIGLSSTMPFFKGTLQKLEVEPYIFRVGDFKSAVEPFMLEKMSDESRLQSETLLNGVYNNITSKIASSRGIAHEELLRISKDMLVRNAEDALNYKLVDMLAYRDQAEAFLKQKLGLEEKKDIEFVSYAKYNKSYEDKNTSRNRIAVIVAEGEIIQGKSQGNSDIGSEDIAKELKRARLDDKTKAIVLRINSPGGSAYASDIMWREIVLASAAKPVIATMSDVAASGGYYMAMACDTIVASPMTITGSIGVFGLLLNVEKMLENKLGITTDNVSTGNFSDLGNMSRPMKEAEKQVIQAMVDDIYGLFVSKAAEGRKMSVEDLKKVASGRVWTGEDALERGLVDVFGNMDDAIQIAAAKAGIEDDFRIRLYPIQKSPFEQIMETFGEEVEVRVLKMQLGEYFPLLQKLNQLKKMQGIQAKMPYEVIKSF